MICSLLNLCHMKCVTRVCYPVDEPHDLDSDQFLIPVPNCGMIYLMILKNDRFLQTLRGFYIHGQGHISMTLSALTYEPYLILYKTRYFYQEFYFHISTHAFIPLLTYSLQCCLELTVLWVSVTAFNSIVRLAHGRPVLNGWARLVVPVGFGCPGSLTDVLGLHVLHVSVAKEHAHFSLAVQSRSIGVCRFGCPDPDLMMNRAQPVFCVYVWLLFICTVYICTHSRILTLLGNVYWLSYDFK